MEKQGLVSILGSDYSQGTKTAAASFRRNLSADMSSKKWLAQNGFKSPLMKKIASSEQLSIISLLDSSSSSEEAEEFDGKKLGQIRKQDDVWSSIISQNKTQELPPPYVHPLLKKASSSLSEKSLKICTESLGSETGSDGFSSSETGSEADESDKAEELSQSQTQQEKEYLQSSIVPEESAAVAKYNYSAASCKKSVQPRSFPPPLPSLARSSEGPSLHMHSHRQNGRLLLEAVSVLSTKNFHAQRQDGRLRLTLLNTTTTLDQQQIQQLKNDEAVILDQKGDKVEEDLEEVFDIFDKVQEENEIEEDEEEEMAEEIEKGVNEPQDMGIVMEQAVPKMARGMINVHRSAFIIKNSMGLENQKPTWTHKFNYTPAKLMQVDAADEEPTHLPHSLPPRPRAAWLILGDRLDGYVARKMRINSVVGSYLDPLADKVLIGCVALAMVDKSLLHPGLVGLILLRDVALVGGAVYNRANSLDWEWKNWLEFLNLDETHAQKVEPLLISKINTVFQLVLVAAALLQPEFGSQDTQSYITYLSWLVASTTVASTAAYGVHHLRSKHLLRKNL